MWYVPGYMDVSCGACALAGIKLKDTRDKVLGGGYNDRPELHHDQPYNFGHPLQSVHMILGQLLLVAAPKAMTAVSGGPHGPLFTTGTGHGFGVSLVAGRSTLDLSLTYIHRPKRSKWRLLERPIVASISTSCYSPRP